MRRTATLPRIAYDVAGESGTPVLLIMGLGMRGEIWGPQIEALRPHHRVATYDHRGLGESETSRRAPWTMRDMAEDALRVLDDLGWDRAHIAGVSLGGMIAQELVLSAPERALSATFIATQPGGSGRWLPPRPGLARFLRARFGGRGRVIALRDLLYPPDFVEGYDRDALEEQLTLRFGVPAPRRTVLSQISAVLHHDASKRLRSLTLPTLIVRPGRDILIDPSRSDALAAAIPHARVVRLDEAGHGVTFQCADALNAAMLSHFAEVDGRGPARDDSREPADNIRMA